MRDFFDTPFADGVVEPHEIFMCLGAALIMGIIFSFMCFIKTKSTKSFLVATALIPTTVALVIILVNGNLGVGIAIAGAFSLVRFRSAPGTAKEIAIIFIAMSSGLAFGMGFLAYGSIFMLTAGGILLLLEFVDVLNPKTSFKEKIVRITIPEDLDYTSVFDDIFSEYTKKAEIIKVKTINMGSMFRIYYQVVLKDVKREKEMIDQIRIRNGNLEVSVQRIDYQKSEL